MCESITPRPQPIEPIAVQKPKLVVIEIELPPPVAQIDGNGFALAQQIDWLGRSCP